MATTGKSTLVNEVHGAWNGVLSVTIKIDDKLIPNICFLNAVFLPELPECWLRSSQSIAIARKHKKRITASMESLSNAQCKKADVSYTQNRITSKKRTGMCFSEHRQW